MATYDETPPQVTGYERYTITRAGVVTDTLKNTQIAVIEHTNAKGSTYQVLNLWSDEGKKKLVYLHRLLALAFRPNPENKPCVDHCDRDSLNNDLSNLRWATYSENSRNSTKKKGATSPFMGVCWQKAKQKWAAQINMNGRTKNLGLYQDEQEAACAYDRKALELGYLHHNQLLAKKTFPQNG